MAKEKIIKTNALRILDSNRIIYQVRTYVAPDGFLDGVSVAVSVGLDPSEVYKTLVLQNSANEHFVCVIPVDRELDLKKVARHFGAKRIEMILAKDITPVTGYIKGGCSPVGMKKAFRTAFAQQASTLDDITVSAGKVGLQMTLKVSDLIKITNADFADLTE